MVTLANINIWGQKAATVMWNDNTQSAVFEYERDFERSGLELSPIQMPLHGRHAYTFASLSHDTFMGLPGLLADALPDAYGKALLDRWLASLGRTFANPVERLCYQGKRCMGALEFEPAQDSFLEQGSSIEIDSLVQVAREALDAKSQLNVNLDADRKEALLNIIKVGTSAGGQRAKAVIAYNPETGEVRSGQVDAPQGFTQWLLKLDGVTNQELGDPKHYGRIEYAYYLMALRAGIGMMPSRLLEENGRAHFMTRRFDRTDDNQKLHMQTLCGVAHFDYKLLRAYSYEQAFQVMRQLHLPYSQAEEMFRRMVAHGSSLQPTTYPGPTTRKENGPLSTRCPSTANGQTSHERTLWLLPPTCTSTDRRKSSSRWKMQYRHGLKRHEILAFQMTSCTRYNKLTSLFEELNPAEYNF